MRLLFRCSAMVRRKLFRFFFGSFLDAGQLIGPETLEILNPVMHGFKLLWVEPIQPALPGLVNINDTHFSQHAQVLRNSRLGKPELDHQLSNITLRPQREVIHNLPPPRFCDGVKNIGRCRCSSHAFSIFRYGNMSSKKIIGFETIRLGVSKIRAIAILLELI
jgi:hypothetical protein